MKNRIFIPGKLKAFTILEMIVAMILSFFLLGMIYLSYNIMSRYLNQNKESDLSRLLLLRAEFEMIFFQASSIEEKDGGLRFYCEHMEPLYSFSNNAIIRKQNSLSDTIYSGKYSYRINQYSSSGKISRLALSFEDEKDTLQMTFEKQYWPNHLLKDKEISFEY